MFRKWDLFGRLIKTRPPDDLFALCNSFPPLVSADCQVSATQDLLPQEEQLQRCRSQFKTSAIELTEDAAICACVIGDEHVNKANAHACVGVQSTEHSTDICVEERRPAETADHQQQINSIPPSSSSLSPSSPALLSLNPSINSKVCTFQSQPHYPILLQQCKHFDTRRRHNCIVANPYSLQPVSPQPAFAANAGPVETSSSSSFPLNISRCIRTVDKTTSTSTATALSSSSVCSPHSVCLGQPQSLNQQRWKSRHRTRLHLHVGGGCPGSYLHPRQSAPPLSPIIAVMSDHTPSPPPGSAGDLPVTPSGLGSKSSDLQTDLHPNHLQQNLSNPSSPSSRSPPCGPLTPAIPHAIVVAGEHSLLAASTAQLAAGLLDSCVITGEPPESDPLLLVWPNERDDYELGEVIGKFGFFFFGIFVTDFQTQSQYLGKLCGDRTCFGSLKRKFVSTQLSSHSREKTMFVKDVINCLDNNEFEN